MTNQDEAPKLHLVCPRCGTTNRMARHRLAMGGRCGECRTTLFGHGPIEIDGDRLWAHVRTDGIPVLVDVWAPWCGPCRMMGPELANATKILEPTIRILKLNSDQHSAVAFELGIKSIPTLLLFDRGREVRRMSGALASRDIVAWVSQSIAASL